MYILTWPNGLYLLHLYDITDTKTKYRNLHFYYLDIRIDGMRLYRLYKKILIKNDLIRNMHHIDQKFLSNISNHFVHVYGYLLSL